MTGNPFTSAGAFYDSHHLRRELYRTVRIGAFDTPNVEAGRVVVPGMITEEDIADRKAEWGARSAQYVGGVLGEFPEGLDDEAGDATRAATTGGGAEPGSRRGRWCSAATWRGSVTTRRSMVRRQGPFARIVCEGFWGRHDEDGGVPAGVLHE